MIVPLKPEELVTGIEMLPDLPGAEMFTNCDEEIAAKKPGVIVKLTGVVLLLAWKLLSLL